MSKDEILKELKPLFEQAEKDDLWFFSPYQQMWFSPSELKARQSEGYYVWGSQNWILRPPVDKIVELETLKSNIQTSINDMWKRIHDNEEGMGKNEKTLDK